MSPRLAAFVRDAVRFASSGAEDDLRRLLRAPFSGVQRADAGALLIVAASRRDLLETIARERVPLSRDAQLACRRFAKAVEELRNAFRAQGATARELVCAVTFAFDLRENASSAEAATLDALEAAAARLDAACAARDATWTVRELSDSIETLVREAVLDEAALGTLESVPSSAANASRSSAADSGVTVSPVPDSVVPREVHTLRPVPREAARNVRRRRGHFSASSLGTYASCERQWFFRYVCSAVEDKGSSASVYGRAFHWALEHFHQEFRRADSAPPDVLARALETWVATAFERFRSGFDTNVEYELQRRRARRTAARYLEWFVERGRAAPFSVVGTEENVETTLDGYAFVGFIDRLDRDDATGAITVVDYKTGNIVESAAEFREDVEAFRDFQLPFYYWARLAEGDRVTRLALVPLKDAQREIRPIELEVVPLSAPAGRWNPAPEGTIGIPELQRARARMVEIARRLSDEPIEYFPPAEDPDACKFCAYINACRERPLQREDRFGR